MDNQSVSNWLKQLKNGDPDAAQKLWERFYTRMIRVANARLGALQRQVADEDDVVVVAFAEFCSGVALGQFPRLNDRNDLWRILFRIVDRKAIDQIRYLTAEKRGGGRVQTESAIGRLNNHSSENWGANHVMDVEPSPQFAIVISEEVQYRLNQLDVNEQKIAISKMQGHTNREISELHGFSQRTVERKIALIKKTWLNESKDDAS